MSLRFTAKMDDDWAVKIFFEVLDDPIDVILSGLNEVDGCDAMKLLSVVFDMEVECYVVLAKIFHFEESGVEFAVVVVEDEHFP